MTRPGSHTALLDEVVRFQAEIQRLAFAAVRAVIKQELARRRARPEPARPRKRRPAQRAQGQLELGLAQEPQRQLELPLAQHAAADAEPHAASVEPQPDAVVPPTVTPEEQPNLQPAVLAVRAGPGRASSASW